MTYPLALQKHAQEAVDQGLLLQISLLYGAMVWIGGLYNIPAPEIISGARTQEEQDALWWRWYMGDSGVAVEPAENSQHLQANAFDIEAANYETLRKYGLLWSRVFGRTWGGNFREADPHHFDGRAA